MPLSRTTLQFGVSARSVHLADFHGAGNLDIAVLNGSEMGPGSLAVMLHSPAGYSAPIITPVGADGSWSMAVADFNHDGKMDVAVVNNLSDNVTILLGNGDGSFHIAGYYPTHTGPSAIVAADFNGDGHPDLAVVNSGSGDVTILLGLGDGRFSTGPSIYLGSAPTGITAADFNGDGIQDLAVTNGALFWQQVLVLLGNGDGSFRLGPSVPTGIEPIALAAGRFIPGGNVDLAVANLASNDVSVLTGAGNGAFQPSATYAAGNGPAGIVTADLNGDGLLDLAVCNDVSGTVSIYLGNGDGTFQAPRSLSTGSSPTSIAVGGKMIVTAGPEGIIVLY
ncbi:MAG: VCBS repeat-containing protein [Bryobacteraceae bacterium]